MQSDTLRATDCTECSLSEHSVHRVDFARVMVLRTGSNECMPQPGETPVQSISKPYIGSLPALESAWLVGSTVLHQILTNWPQYADHIPGS